MQHVFIIGSKGIPGSYGGFETFVDNLVSYQQNTEVKYHVACQKGETEYEYHGARCFRVDVPQIGAAKAVFYDLKAFRMVTDYIAENQIGHAVIYVLACRIGPFFRHCVKKAHKCGAKVYVNPDGHEWLRAKWNKLIKKYWKWSEKLMTKHADLMICDSKGIEKYIRQEYKKYQPETTYIAYGVPDESQDSPDEAAEEALEAFYREHGIAKQEYYLIVGRFVPENNYETCLREYRKTETDKPLIIISNVEKNAFYEKLRISTGFEEDARIRFVGTVYDKTLLMQIRRYAFAYLHGHEVGGTNPSLLEALASTDVNLLYRVIFNEEVAGDSAVYFEKTEGSLSACIRRIEQMTEAQRKELGRKAKARIKEAYTIGYIVSAYESLFTEEIGEGVTD